MTAQEILKLIESVDPQDTAKLDEIDFGVETYLGNRPYYKGFRHFTRHRDFLKEIRPKGWFVGLIRYTSTNTLSGDGGYECLLLKTGTAGVSSRHLVTEELAELHAVIQAIEHDRATDQQTKGGE